MSGVPTSVVHVVDMIPVRDRDMTASFTVSVVMMLVHGVAGWLAFVIVAVVASMDVTVVHVVDVIPVRDRDVTASFAVCMAVFAVLVVDCAGHLFLRQSADFDSLAAVWSEFSPANNMCASSGAQPQRATRRTVTLITTIIFIKLAWDRPSPLSLRSTYYRADLDSFTAGAALGVAEQRSGAGFVARRRRGVELA